ncbi:hypothetical protein C463_07052 [Halorubrum californiense DSM 19288]|uniref:DUF3179 domain-containing protein n=1 Tax=Halorubrum californiense DSM 19288 TaxID=1227465 RepID=M0ECU1_9EURY|nr:MULTISPECIES: DUF3179 domain-containing protein [Halorubrum]ELZ44697.1 hypothetical protein C463_07052 [Halorubrum californiense DSM 19288]TKX71657.1 DUF3179 domain-containing protein [Halorubrum sp. GN11GM_10-3_MGM]
MKRTRRAALVGIAGVGAASLAGCLGGRATGTADRSDRESSEEESGGDGPPPTVDADYLLAYEAGALASESLDGGVGKDGIPSVDDPTFEPISEADLADDEPVFGVVRGGEAKAYPRRILSHHEIVNDEVGGEPVAVTYCPLTGTAQGFRRGDTTFGVSGRLVNSNLVMYDRATDSWWPQMLAAGVDGPMTGETLDEFRVVWTTASEWAARRPDSLAMTEETGYVRRYDSDPYGSYAPLNGYYSRDGTMFPPLASAEEGHPKSVVLGARTDAGAVAFDKATLLSERVLTGTVGDGDASVLAVADPGLSTGYVYRNPNGAVVEPDDDGYRVDGEGGVAAADLPLERVLAFDAMWFAWFGFYPDTAFVGEHTGAGYGR